MVRVGVLQPVNGTLQGLREGADRSQWLTCPEALSHHDTGGESAKGREDGQCAVRELAFSRVRRFARLFLHDSLMVDGRTKGELGNDKGGCYLAHQTKRFDPRLLQ